MTANPVTAKRKVIRTSPGMPASDGAGVKLTRMLGTPHLMEHDPFLMLDRFQSDDANDYMAGFPDHPHRGFETVTIMIDGRMRHGDNKGNSGVIGPGGMQYMTAGRGIVHSEMPEQEDGMMFGFQLWVNLPSNKKMTAPRYQDYEASAIPIQSLDNGGQVRVLAGQNASGLIGPATSSGDMAPVILDIHLPAGAQHQENLPDGMNAFVAVWQGQVIVEGEDDVTSIDDPDIGLLGDGGPVDFTAGEDGARFLLIAGYPIKEPVVRYGPFVMNSREEIIQAMDDFHSGKF